MPIHYVKGSIFQTEAMALVNPVNCVGVMGKGLALEFKKRAPEMFERYAAVCKAKKLKPGILHYYSAEDCLVVNFPTKVDWRNPSELDYIEQGLRTFRKNYAKRNISSVAFPPLGCGLGGLKWTDVKALMEKYLSDLPIDVYIYQPKEEL